MEAKIYSLRLWIENTNPSQLKNTFTHLLNKANFDILQFNEHTFSPQGYTCFWLLGESHLAIHTFPESKKSYIELSSCNLEKKNTFEKELPFTILEKN